MITVGDYLVGITADDGQGQSFDVFDKYIFSELYIHEAVNNVPYFELFLAGNEYGTLFKYKEFKLSFSSDNLKYDVPMGVINMMIQGNYLMIRGYLVKYLDIRVPQTRYLGKDAKEALQTLQIRDKINYEDNLTGNIFQVNTTNLQQALGICQMCAKTPFWNIGRYSINLDPKVEESSSEVFASSDSFVFSTNVDTLPQGPDDNDSFPWMSYSLNKSSLDYHLIEHHDLHNNMLYNRKTSATGPSLVLTKTFGLETPEVVGTEYKNNDKDSFPDVTKWVLTSVMYRYNQHQINSQLQFFGVTDAIEQQQWVNDNLGK